MSAISALGMAGQKFRVKRVQGQHRLHETPSQNKGQVKDEASRPHTKTDVVCLSQNQEGLTSTLAATSLSKDGSYRAWGLPGTVLFRPCFIGWQT